MRPDLWGELSQDMFIKSKWKQEVLDWLQSMMMTQTLLGALEGRVFMELQGRHLRVAVAPMAFITPMSFRDCAELGYINIRLNIARKSIWENSMFLFCLCLKPKKSHYYFLWVPRIHPVLLSGYSDLCLLERLRETFFFLAVGAHRSGASGHGMFSWWHTLTWFVQVQDWRVGCTSQSPADWSHVLGKLHSSADTPRPSCRSCYSSAGAPHALLLLQLSPCFFQSGAPHTQLVRVGQQVIFNLYNPSGEHTVTLINSF